MSDNILEKNEDPRNYRFAGFGIRTGAFMIDFLVTLPLLVGSIYVLITQQSLPIIIGIILVVAAYKPIMEYQYGATLGKMALNIHVINEEGGLPSGNQSIIRYIPWLIGYIISVLMYVEQFNSGGIQEVNGWMEYIEFTEQYSTVLSNLDKFGLLFILISSIVIVFNQQKQAFHDKIAKTYCIHKN